VRRGERGVERGIVEQRLQDAVRRGDQAEAGGPKRQAPHVAANQLLDVRPPR